MSARRRGDGSELTPLGKIAYKPFGLVFGMLGLIWKRVSDEDETTPVERSGRAAAS